jgi:ABC-type lipoprotein export system ATPase subunit
MEPDRGVLAASRVCVDYRSADGIVAAVVDVDVDVPAGSLTVLAGPSGSGKSSLLRVLGLLDRPTSGSLSIEGIDVLAWSDHRRRALRRDRLAYVHQRPITNLVDQLSAHDQVVFACQVRGVPRPAVDDVLARFGLREQARSRPAELSGGEQQRLAIAMATVVEPWVWFADEPTAELDRRHADEVIDAIRLSVEEGRSVVVASHDPALIDAATDVLWLHQGRRGDHG